MVAEVDNPLPCFRARTKFLCSLCYNSFFSLLGEQKPPWFGLPFGYLPFFSFLNRNINESNKDDSDIYY